MREFNTCGAHSSGLIGKAPQASPANILALIIKVAQGRSRFLNVTGSDYEESYDGTAIRDYTHIQDVARGYREALREQITGLNGYNVFNLATGRGTSVKELISIFNTWTENEVEFMMTERRPDDVG
jgi:UDP-glucose 4-epimerase